MRDQRLTPVGKALLALLGTFTDKNGWCHPKQTELAAALGVSREYVSRTLRTLVELGYVDTRSFTASRRGRVALEYRVRTDLPDEVVQAAENSRCEPDVIQSSQRPAKALKTADVIQSSQRGRCEQEITSVLVTSLRSVPNRTTPKAFPENFIEAWERWPQRGRSSKAKSAEAWARANRQHGAAAALSALDAYLASPDARKDAGQYVPALERWLRDKLDTWLEIAAGKPALVQSQIDWPAFIAAWRENATHWPSSLGPKPDEPGYRGPPVTEPDLFQTKGARA
jgi:hypothetical protein